MDSQLGQTFNLKKGIYLKYINGEREVEGFDMLDFYDQIVHRLEAKFNKKTNIWTFSLFKGRTEIQGFEIPLGKNCTFDIEEKIISWY